MIDLIDRISDAFIAELARLGWPPLADLVDGSQGRILTGDHHQFGQAVPPRVIFRPLKSPFGPRDTTLGAQPSSASPRFTTEGRAAITNPAFMSEEFGFEVRCWGICPRDEDVEKRASELDYTFTRGLYHTLISSMQLLIPNAFKVEAGSWKAIRHTPRVGREFVFNIAIGIPVLRLGISPPTVTGWTPGEPYAVSPKAPDPPIGGVQQQGSPRAPAGVKPAIEDSMVTPTGQAEPGCEEPEP